MPIFMVWSLGILFSAIPADCGLRVYAQNRYLIAVNIVRLAVVVALVAPLLGRFGLVGPAAATLLALGVFKLAAAARVGALLGVSLRRALPWKSLARTFALAAAATVPPLLVMAGTDWSPLMTMLACVPLYGVGYAALMLTVGGLDNREKDDLTGWLMRPLGFKGEAPCAE